MAGVGEHSFQLEPGRLVDRAREFQDSVARNDPGPPHADGHLVGFLASRATVADTEGGPDLLLARDGLAGLIARGVKTKSPSYYWMTKRTVVPKPAEGLVFPVYGVFCEKLNKDEGK